MTPWNPLPRLVPMTSTRSPTAKMLTSTGSPALSASPPGTIFTSRRTRVGGTLAFLKAPAEGLFTFGAVSSTSPSCTDS